MCLGARERIGWATPRQAPSPLQRADRRPIAFVYVRAGGVWLGGAHQAPCTHWRPERGSAQPRHRLARRAHGRPARSTVTVCVCGGVLCVWCCICAAFGGSGRARAGVHVLARKHVRAPARPAPCSISARDAPGDPGPGPVRLGRRRTSPPGGPG